MLLGLSPSWGLASIKPTLPNSLPFWSLVEDVLITFDSGFK